jgi:basic membrane protein A and related proteins
VNRRRSLAVVLVAVAATLLASGCGSKSTTGTTTTNTTPTTTNAAGNFKMAIVTDIGSLQDRSFNQLANEGRKAVGAELGIPTRVYETKSEADRIPNMLAASRAGHNLIFGVGFLNYNALNSVAPRFPHLQYAGIDEDYALFKSKPKNATGVIFTEQQAGYLVGYLAALEMKHEGHNTISAVGANNVPAIVRYISGYIQGAHKAYPGIRVLANYANDPTFNDQAKCHETALQQINQGSHVVFQVAGGCGLGALQAAKENHVWGIGVDADQRYLGAHIMTSALKKVDKAVEDLTKLAHQGKLKTGGNYTFDLSNGGVGLGSVSPKIPQSYVAKTLAIGKLIGQGKIVVKPTIKF